LPKIAEDQIMAVTINDIAKAAGVSVSTVSRVLSNSPHPISQETKNLIYKIAEEMGYTPNILARGLRREQSFMIGVVVDNISSPFAPQIIRGIQHQLQNYNYSILIGPDTGRNHEIEAAVAKNLNARQVDGIIFVDTSLHVDNAKLDWLEKPIVYVNRFMEASCHNCIGPDDYQNARIAVRHLAEIGHRQIAYIAGPPGWIASENRLMGYIEELNDWDILIDEDMMEIEGNKWSVQTGYRCAFRLLQRRNPPTAIFGANDLIALGAIYAAKELGRTISGEFSIIGYDDRYFARFVRPSISTVTMPNYEMGLVAAETLMDLFNDNLSPESSPRLICGNVIRRKTTGFGEVDQDDEFIFEDEWVDERN
jgi:DNA-binding LacI/PurR family transcriptional regulator